jgi:hypothetical protein
LRPGAGRRGRERRGQCCYFNDLGAARTARRIDACLRFAHSRAVLASPKMPARPAARCAQRNFPPTGAPAMHGPP